MRPSHAVGRLRLIPYPDILMASLPASSQRHRDAGGDQRDLAPHGNPLGRAVPGSQSGIDQSQLSGSPDPARGHDRRCPYHAERRPDDRSPYVRPRGPRSRTTPAPIRAAISKSPTVGGGASAAPTRPSVAPTARPPMAEPMT